MKKQLSENNGLPQRKCAAKPIYRLYLAIALILLTGFLSLSMLLIRQYGLALVMIGLCWLADQKFYVCPFCGAKLKPNIRLNAYTVCGRCSHNLYTGEEIRLQNGRMRVKKQDVEKYV